MAIELTWLGHACWSIKTDQHTILVDPYLDDAPHAGAKSSDVSADFILLTHGHFDHVGDTVKIAKRTGAKVIANFEICEWITKQGVKEDQVQAMNTGGTFRAPFGQAKLTIAQHSSMLPDGSNGGNPNGFLLTLTGAKIYIAGDTALTCDMKWYGHSLDAAILPIGDLYTMGPEDSVEALSMLETRYVLPSHYGTWPPIEQDAEAWAKMVREKSKAEPVVLKVGGTFKL
jgi:L-ascorbate metabolism protein UlaG (beta-lactamase superfamily)